MTTNVEAGKGKTGFWYIIITPAKSENTYVISIDSATGSPSYYGIPMVDIFPDHSLARSYVEEQSEATMTIHGVGLLGMSRHENIVSIGIIDKAEKTGELPGGHIIRVIRHITYINISLIGTQTVLSPFNDFQLENNLLN